MVGTCTRDPTCVRVAPSRVCEGVGVFATRHIPKDAEITFYGGLHTTWKRFVRLRAKYRELLEERLRSSTELTESTECAESLYSQDDENARRHAPKNQSSLYRLRRKRRMSSEEEGRGEQQSASNTRRSPLSFLRRKLKSLDNADYRYRCRDGTIIDGLHKGYHRWCREGVGHLLNDAVHRQVTGLDNNCVFQEKSDNATTEMTRVVIVATRDIEPGEELLASYSLSYWMARLGEMERDRDSGREKLRGWLRVHDRNTYWVHHALCLREDCLCGNERPCAGARLSWTPPYIGRCSSECELVEVVGHDTREAPWHAFARTFMTPVSSHATCYVVRVSRGGPSCGCCVFSPDTSTTSSHEIGRMLVVVDVQEYEGEDDVSPKWCDAVGKCWNCGLCLFKVIRNRLIF